MKKLIKELLDQATILAHRKTNDEIAEYLELSHTVAFPVGIGDKVYYVVNGNKIVEREVDALQYDWRIKIIARRPNPDISAGDIYGELCGDWGDTVFKTKEEAKRVCNIS